MDKRSLDLRPLLSLESKDYCIGLLEDKTSSHEHGASIVINILSGGYRILTDMPYSTLMMNMYI